LSTGPRATQQPPLRPLIQRVRSTQVLVGAWHEIRRNAETSCSPATKDEARKFGRDLPRNLRRIQDRLRAGYVFKPAKGATPSKGGGKAGKRPLVIAPMADRIVQRAILDVLQDAPDLPAVRQVLDTPTSIGGIKGRGVEMALDLIDERHAAGARFVAGSDIAGFFTKIPRGVVAAFVRANTNDEQFAALFERAMTVELANASTLSPEDLRLFPTGEDGVAQGCPLSAFAGNVVLREFDAAMNADGRGVTCVRYIDDFILLAATERQVTKAMQGAAAMLKKLGMTIYDPLQAPTKAFTGTITAGCIFLGYEIIPGRFPPSEKARERLLDRIAAELKAGRAVIRDALKGEPIVSRKSCYIQTLASVDQIVRGWAGSFRRSRCPATMAKLDLEIDRKLADFEGFYRRQMDGLDATGRRRVTGVRLLQDR
jgi:RNA-directed DNA polymerase